MIPPAAQAAVVVASILQASQPAVPRAVLDGGGMVIGGLAFAALLALVVLPTLHMPGESSTAKAPPART